MKYKEGNFLPHEFNSQKNAFQFTIDQQDAFRLYSQYFLAYQKYQDILSLKFPKSLNFRVAKFQNVRITDNSTIEASLYYDGYNEIKHQIAYDQFCKSAIPLKAIYGEVSRLDVLAIKAAFQGLVEILYWSQNFGFFFDPVLQNLLFKEGETELYIFIPDFKIVSTQLRKTTTDSFDQFRSQIYQNLTLAMLAHFIKQFISEIKEQDDDHNQYITIQKKWQYKDESVDKLVKIEEKLFGVDFIFSEDFIKKKMIRYGLKQTQFLYQLKGNQIMKNQFIKHRQQEKDIIKQCDAYKNPLTENLKSFFLSIAATQGVSYDIPTPFGQAWIKKKIRLSDAFRRNWKAVTTKHELVLKIQNQDNQKEEDSKNLEVQWSSEINNQNIIYQSLTQSGQLISPNIKKVTQNYKIELLEAKNCFVVKSQVPEVIFGIDSADDIAYFINSLQKEQLSTNIYVDDTRKMTFYTALLYGKQNEFLEQIIKVMDIHQIYFYLCLEFYYRNIQIGKQIKEIKYRTFITELKNLILDYENDFEKQITTLQNDTAYEF